MELLLKITLWFTSLFDQHNDPTAIPLGWSSHCGAVICKNVQLKRTFQKDKHADIQPGANKGGFAMLTTYI